MYQSLDTASEKNFEKISVATTSELHPNNRTMQVNAFDHNHTTAHYKKINAMEISQNRRLVKCTSH